MAAGAPSFAPDIDHDRPAHGADFVEPDLGSSIVFIPVGLAMMFLAGIPSYLIRLLLAASAMVLLVC